MTVIVTSPWKDTRNIPIDDQYTSKLSKIKDFSSRKLEWSDIHTRNANSLISTDFRNKMHHILGGNVKTELDTKFKWGLLYPITYMKQNPDI